MDLNMMPPPIIIITEQPKQRGMRFRYECEGRSAGSIPGERTTPDRKTWPSIRIANYSGEVTVRVSLVSKDSPPRPHPHSLVGKDCVNGICTVRVLPETQMTATFSNLGIQCVKRREVAGALKLRQSLKVDPFNLQSDSDPQVADVDLNIVRLCFEAFISKGNNQHLVLQPVVSNPIYDKKATSSSVLRICRVDKSFGSCKGGEEVYLLCDKVQKDDIQICFYESNDRGTVTWEAYGVFSPTDVHRQVAIVFRTPPYRDANLREAIHVLFQLKRMSDGETSEAKDFTYLPQQHVQPQMQMRGPISPARTGRHAGKRAKEAIYECINKKLRTEAYDGQNCTSTFGSQMPQMNFPMTPYSGLQPGNVLDKFLQSQDFTTQQFPLTQTTGLGTSMAPMHDTTSATQWTTSGNVLASLTPARMSSPPDYTTPITNSPDLMAPQQHGHMTSPLALQQVEAGPSCLATAQLTYSTPPTPQQGVEMGLSTSMAPMQRPVSSTPQWTMSAEQDAMMVSLPPALMPSPHGYTTPMPNGPMPQRGHVTSSHSLQHGEAGRTRTPSGQHTCNAPPTPQAVEMAVGVMPPTPEMNYNVPTTNVEIGAMSGFSAATEPNYSVVDDRMASFGGITEGMTYLSIEKIEGVSPLVKTEPGADVQNMLTEFPNQTMQPPAYPNPVFTMQAPSPQQVQSPQQLGTNIEMGASATTLQLPVTNGMFSFGNGGYTDLDDNLPSYDLNDPGVASTQDLEEIMPN